MPVRHLPPMYVPPPPAADRHHTARPATRLSSRLSVPGRLSPPLFQAVCDRRMSVCHWAGCCRRLYRSAPVPWSTVASPAPHRSPLDRVTSHHSPVTKSPITSHQCRRPAHSRTASVRLPKPTLGRPEAPARNVTPRRSGRLDSPDNVTLLAQNADQRPARRGTRRPPREHHRPVPQEEVWSRSQSPDQSHRRRHGVSRQCTVEIDWHGNSSGPELIIREFVSPSLQVQPRPAACQVQSGPFLYN